MVAWYIEETEIYGNNEINALFCPDVYFEYVKCSRNYLSRYLTYSNVCAVLKLFYEEIIKEQYGYEVLYDDVRKYIGTNEIQIVHLGDTRHIALINLMKEGGNPVIAMTMSGHENMTMFEHYASNIDSFLECMAEREYRMITSSKNQFTVSRYKGPLNVSDFTPLDNGRCYSPKFKNCDFTDCANVFSYDGAIGRCEDCTYFRRDDMSFNNSKEIYLSRIKNDLELIRILYKQLKHEGEEPDDIIRAAMQYQEDALTYQKYLLETREFNHGKTE